MGQSILGYCVEQSLDRIDKILSDLFLFFYILVKFKCSFILETIVNYFILYFQLLDSNQEKSLFSFVWLEKHKTKDIRADPLNFLSLCFSN